MSKEQLSEDQKARINTIINDWEKEREELQKSIPATEEKMLDGERTRINLMLERKYVPLIQAIMAE